MSETSAPSRPPRWRRRLLGSATVLLLFFGGVELLLRVVGFDDHSLMRWTGEMGRGQDLVLYSGELFESDPELIWALRPGASTIWFEKPVQVNSLGLRDREITPDKPANTLRVLCLGDSSVFGHGLEVDHGFPRQLEAALSTHGGGKRYEVLNLGVPGYSTQQSLIQLRRLAPVLQPDFLVIYNAHSDYFLDAVEDKQRVDLLASQSNQLVRHSRLYQLLRKLLLPLAVRVSGRHDPFSTHRVSLEDYRANLELMIAEGAGRGAGSILVVAPLVLREKRSESEVGAERALMYWDVMREVGAAKGAPVVDMHEKLGDRMYNERETLFLDDCHPTRWGNALITDELRLTIERMAAQGRR
jgi:lysophospholipase L1-like esterase